MSNQKYPKFSEVTPEQIQKWKKQFGEESIRQLTLGGEHSIIVRLARRNEIGAATASAKSNPAKFSEILLKKVWLAGDMDAVFADESLLNAATGCMEELIPVAEAEIKKL